LREWTLNNRLDGYSRMVANVKPEETEKVALLKSMRTNSMAAVLKLQNYIAELA
jgi:hypothetical protein